MRVVGVQEALAHEGLGYRDAGAGLEEPERVPRPAPDHTITGQYHRVIGRLEQRRGPRELTVGRPRVGRFGPTAGAIRWTTSMYW